VISSPQDGEYEKFFSLDQCNSSSMSIALRSFHRNRIISIDDTGNQEGFPFFSPNQKDRIKSIVACPLTESSGSLSGVIVFDSNQPHSFSESDSGLDLAELLLLMGSRISLRLEYENNVKKLLSAVETSISEENV